MTARESLPAGVAEVASQLDAWFLERFEHLQSLAEDYLAMLSLDSEGRLDLTEGLRRKLRTRSVRYLAENPHVDGCGLIFAHSALGTENGHLEWWVREDESRFARYSFGVVPGADRYYDYEHHEWFIRAYHEGTQTLIGPYIDYLGVEAYVLTLTTPSEIDGVRIGAIGNDMQAADLEAAVLPLLLQHRTEMALVGLHGTVLVGNSSRFLPGLYVPSALEGFERIALHPESAGVQLLYRV